MCQTTTVVTVHLYIWGGSMALLQLLLQHGHHFLHFILGDTLGEPAGGKPPILKIGLLTVITVKRGGGGSVNPLRKAKCPNFDNKLCIIVRYSSTVVRWVHSIHWLCCT